MLPTISLLMTTITEAVSADHREIAHCCHNILDATDIDTAGRWQNQLTLVLAQHLSAMELVVYPALEDISDQRGKIIAKEIRPQHQNVSLQKQALWSTIRLHFDVYIAEREALELSKCEGGLG
jgi:hemerythrin superfamily protein